MKTESIILPIASVLIVLIIYLGAFRLYAFNEGFYAYEFRRHNVHERSPNADSISAELIEYLKGSSYGYVDIEGFSEREKSHMADVKRLIDGFVIALYASLSLFLLLAISCIARMKRAELTALARKALLYSGMGGIAVFAAMLIAALNFNLLFDNFHYLFFRPGTWVFAENELLISTFPWQFFQDSLFAIMISALIVSIALAAAGTLMPRSGTD
jgi:integral membrane protein (TIGR01906 family)